MHFIGVRLALLLGAFVVFLSPLPEVLHPNVTAQRALVPAASAQSAPSANPSLEYLGGIGGYIGGIAVSGTYAYLAEGAGLTILNINDPASPTYLSRLLLPVVARDVQVVDDRAYVVASEGVYIADVSAPAQPVLLSTFLTASKATSVEVVDHRAYITVSGVYSSTTGIYEDKGLQIVDVGDPAAPALLGFYETSNTPSAIHVAGSRAYLGTGGGREGEVLILDLANVAQPTLLGRFGAVNTVFPAIQVQNDLAFVASVDPFTFQRGLRVLNVADPANPSQRSMFADIPAEDLILNGSLAYVIDGRNKLRIVNVSNPDQLIVRSSYQLPRRPQKLSLVDGLAYVTMYDYGMQVVDVGNPDAPVAAYSISQPRPAINTRNRIDRLGVPRCTSTHHVQSCLRFGRASSP